MPDYNVEHNLWPVPLIPTICLAYVEDNVLGANIVILTFDTGDRQPLTLTEESVGALGIDDDEVDFEYDQTNWSIASIQAAQNNPVQDNGIILTPDDFPQHNVFEVLGRFANNNFQAISAIAVLRGLMQDVRIPSDGQVVQVNDFGGDIAGVQMDVASSIVEFVPQNQPNNYNFLVICQYAAQDLSLRPTDEAFQVLGNNQVPIHINNLDVCLDTGSPTVSVNQACWDAMLDQNGQEQAVTIRLNATRVDNNDAVELNFLNIVFEVNGDGVEQPRMVIGAPVLNLFDIRLSTPENLVCNLYLHPRPGLLD